MFLHFALYAEPELRQYKNESIWSKDKLALNFPRFFIRLYGQWKMAAISKLIC